jgi:hypothetical protein
MLNHVIFRATLVTHSGSFLLRFLECLKSFAVTPALVAGIHVLVAETGETWMAGDKPGHDAVFSITNPALRETWTHSERWIVSTR